MKARIATGTVLTAVAVAVWAAAAWWPHVRNEFFVIVGNRDEAGGWYGTWSGFAGGVRVFEWPVIIGVIWWHHQCGVTGCYWYARRTTAAGERACWRHHPHKTRTARQISDAHHEAVSAGKAAA